MADIKNKIVFALVPPDERGTVMLLLGVPEAAWEYMKDGKTHTFDMTALGLPLQLMLYGAKDHDAAKQVIDDYNATRGIAALDARREDFSIKTSEERDGQ